MDITKLFEYDTATQISRKLTNNQLNTLLKNAEKIFIERQLLRFNVIEESICRVLEKYIISEMSENLLDIFQNISVNYCPQFNEFDYMNKSQKKRCAHQKCKGCYITRSHALEINFDHGESLKAKRYKDDDEEQQFDNSYAIRINCTRKGDYIQHSYKNNISINAPVYHISPPPYKNYDERVAFYKSGKVKYDLDTGKVKSQFKKKTRKDVYGDILPAVKKLFIEEGLAELLIDKAKALFDKHSNHLIIEARAATIQFLMIGRFRMDIPYDVTKYIAKMVWNNRYQWRIEEIEDIQPEKGCWEKVEDYPTLRVDPDSHDPQFVKYGWRPYVAFKYN
jgi:hypothetical protein